MFATQISATSVSTTRSVAPRRASRVVALPVRAVLRSFAPAQREKLNDGLLNLPKRQEGLQLGFTKDNELLVGRMAMAGFAMSLIGELITGKGALAQLGYEIFDDKLGTVQIDELIVGLIMFNLIAGILPASGTFVPDEEVEARPKGSLQDPRVTLLEPAKFFGITSFGFTKENELFVGRVAQLGFAASLIGETLTGKGALAQFDIETGINLQETEFGLAAFILFFMFAAVNPGSGTFINDEKEA